MTENPLIFCRWREYRAVEVRHRAKKRGKYSTADKIRKWLDDECWITLSDRPNGTTLIIFKTSRWFFQTNSTGHKTPPWSYAFAKHYKGYAVYTPGMTKWFLDNVPPGQILIKIP